MSDADHRSHDELRELLNEWDPIGVYQPGRPSPRDPDEYEDLNGPLLERLRNGATATEIAEYLSAALRDHYGLDPTLRRPMDFAQRLAIWFDSRQT